MAREDRTFTSGDIVRLWCNNLDKEEQDWTIIFFLTVVPGIYLTNAEVIAIYEKVAEFIKNRYMKLVIKYAIKHMKVLRRFLNSEWANLVFEGPLRKEVLECIKKRTRELR